MAQSKLQQVDLSPEPAPLAMPVMGSMTVTFLDAGQGHMVPEVTFAPLGRINPNTLERFLPFIYREIQREQVKERRNGR